ncbi:Transposable element P transposase [Amphibalanus amphitrite]|uniref:Transposable element P transposase n=1 Tax=Amphibalanus amphitrite TaxID=1232801 RepID=A0A6A4WSQ5_AMPAM|nr:Transposable element P transposase [Amphibalanus amphitrite]
MSFSPLRALAKNCQVIAVEETTPLEQVVRLEGEVQDVQQRLWKLSRKWRNEKRSLQRQLRIATEKGAQLDRLLESGVLSRGQVRQAATGRRIRWSPGDVSKALGLRCLTRKGYKYAQSVLKIPLPSASTLSRWTRAFRVTPGVMDAAASVLEAVTTDMSDMDRLCVISFDEMSLDGRYCYDSTADQVLRGSKLQLLMVRGLCSSWKQPLYYQLDSAMTPGELEHVIIRLEDIGLSVVAATSDMHSSNEKLWEQMGVTPTKTWIKNPRDDSRLVGNVGTLNIWIFADVPHVLKRLRAHTVANDGGLVVPKDEGGTFLLSRQSFSELLSKTAGELRVAPKLKAMHLEATGQCSQRVSLASQLFSETVAAAMAKYVPIRSRQADAIRTIDAWFDVMNSRSPIDAKQERCAYGLNKDVKAIQDAALTKMEKLIGAARKSTPKHPGGVSAMLPFQVGALRSTASLRGLHSELSDRVPKFRYVMSARLNQDCLENTFSQLRGMCGQNVTPDAVEARSRLRIMLMAPSPLVATSSSGRAVRLEPDTAFVSTGQRLEPDNLTNEALEGLQIQIQRPAELTAAVEEDQVEEAFRAVTLQPTVPQVIREENEDGGAATDTAKAKARAAEDAWLRREGLAFVAGYVAASCQHIDPSLGLPTRVAPPSSVPQSWIRAVSRGGLMVPSERWMSVVEAFEVLFCILMGTSADRNPGIVRRLMDLLRQKEPALDLRIARKLVRTRLHIRLRFINQALAEAAAARRAAKQVRQHVRSSVGSEAGCQA